MGSSSGDADVDESRVRNKRERNLDQGVRSFLYSKAPPQSLAEP